MWIVIIELFRFFLYLGEKLFQFVFSIVLCIFVTALFSGYTDYFHYARSFFVCVNHNFVCKTYFCELRYWWKAYLHKSCEILCKSSFQIQKTKKPTLFSWYMKNLNICSLQIWKTNLISGTEIILVILYLCEIGQPLCSVVLLILS